MTSLADRQATTNPTLLVEVTSEPTEAHDRGDTLTNDQLRPSLQAVLFVSGATRDARVSNGSGWTPP